ncbi:MAG: Crp/Fnr family transcriptional regulator, partial [Bacteroidetes bacterium]
IANQKPSINYLSCLEDAVIVIINSEKEEAFYKRFPRFEEISRIETTKMMGENQELLSIFITSSPEERYKYILENKPNLLQIAPQHQIASYIGVTPESLSRIRKRIIK